MYNWPNFLIGFVSAQIFYIINITKLKGLYIAWDLLWYNNFIGNNNFKNIFFK